MQSTATPAHLVEAGREGYRIGALRLSISLCPHQHGTTEESLWLTGWRAAIADVAARDFRALQAKLPAPSTSMDDDSFESRSLDGEYHDASDVLEAERSSLVREAA